MNALQLMEIEHLAVENQQIDERFRIETLDQANWALRKLSAMQAKEAEIKALAQAERDRIQKWEEEEISKLLPQQELFTNWLSDYHRRELEQNPKAKTISTPYGKLKSTTSGPSPKNIDEAALLAYLKATHMKEHIKVTEKPAWGDFKKTLLIVQESDEWYVVDESGYRVPGVTVDMGGTTFRVEVAE